MEQWQSAVTRDMVFEWVRQAMAELLGGGDIRRDTGQAAEAEKTAEAVSETVADAVAEAAEAAADVVAEKTAEKAAEKIAEKAAEKVTETVEDAVETVVEKTAEAIAESAEKAAEVMGEEATGAVKESAEESAPDGQAEAASNEQAEASTAASPSDADPTPQAAKEETLSQSHLKAWEMRLQAWERKLQSGALCEKYGLGKELGALLEALPVCDMEQAAKAMADALIACTKREVEKRLGGLSPERSAVRDARTLPDADFYAACYPHLI